MNGLSAGIAEGRDRLSVEWCGSAFAVTAVLSLAAALLMREEWPTSAVDLTLSEVVFAWGVPLLSYFAVGRATGRGRADRAVEALARWGNDRRAVFSGFVVAITVRVVAISVLVSVLTVLFARARVDSAGLSDALTTSWIAALGALTYTVLFSIGSLLGRSGQGRVVLLGLDFILRALGSNLAAASPQAHLQSLIGGPPVAHLPSLTSAICLAAMSLVCLGVAAVRIRP